MALNRTYYSPRTKDPSQTRFLDGEIASLGHHTRDGAADCSGCVIAFFMGNYAAGRGHDWPNGTFV